MVACGPPPGPVPCAAAPAGPRFQPRRPAPPAPGWPAWMRPGPRSDRALIAAWKSAFISSGHVGRGEDYGDRAAGNRLRTYWVRGEFISAGKLAAPVGVTARKWITAICRISAGPLGLTTPAPATRPFSCGNGTTHVIGTAGPAGERCDRRRPEAGSALPADNHRSFRHNGLAGYRAEGLVSLGCAYAL